MLFSLDSGIRRWVVDSVRDITNEEHCLLSAYFCHDAAHRNSRTDDRDHRQGVWLLNEQARAGSGEEPSPVTSAVIRCQGRDQMNVFLKQSLKA